MLHQTQKACQKVCVGISWGLLQSGRSVAEYSRQQALIKCGQGAKKMDFFLTTRKGKVSRCSSHEKWICV